MKEIQLETMDNRPVNFNGELASQTECKVESADGLDRSFALKLYQIESRGFVPSIEFSSNADGEQSGCIAEIVDDFKDIENFFFVFVPEDLLGKAVGLSREDADARKKLSARLRKAYETLTFAFLDELQEKFSPDEVKPTEAKPAEVSEPEST